MSVIERLIEPRVRAALKDTRVVFVVGPRQAGKTTLVRRFVSNARPFLSFDDAATREAASADPSGFVRGLRGAVLDEIQRVPEVLLAIKESVDSHDAPGRFLLTGSTNVLTLPQVADSLAGRVEVISLLPFAQAEIRRTEGQLLDRLFDEERLPAIRDAVVGDELVELIVAGGYPEALRRSSPARRAAWLEDYAALVLDRDVRDIANIDQYHRLPQLLQVLAAHAGQLVNHSSYGAALGLSSVTAQKYVAILDRLFFTRLLPPWTSNQLGRLTKTPKLHFVDTGLLSVMRGVDASQLRRNRLLLGPLLENFVVSEFFKLAAWAEHRVSFSHFRTKDKEEVDLVLEDRQGRIVGIEVKASATVRADDFRGLRQLQAAVGERFVKGLVLCDHNRLIPFGEKLFAAPVSLLWQS